MFTDVSLGSVEVEGTGPPAGRAGPGRRQAQSGNRDGRQEIGQLTDVSQ
jgi:hypothetical protein